MRLSLRQNFSWTFAGNVVYAASQWGVLVVLARLGSPELVGQFALGLAVTAPVILFANLALRQVQATDARREYTFGEYLGLRLLTTALALLVILFIAVAFYRDDTRVIILMIGLSKSFEAISDIIFGLLQQHERMDRIAKSLMIEGIATLLVAAAVMAVTHSLFLVTAAIAVVWGLQLLFYDLRSGWIVTGSLRLLRPTFRRDSMLRLLWLALPLGFVVMLISLNTNIPRYFIETYLGSAQLGIFAAMGYLMLAGNTVVSALGQSASPRLAAYYAQGNREAYKRLLLRLLAIGACLGAAGILAAVVAGRWLLHLLYGPAYAAYASVFVWVMFAAAVTYLDSFVGYGVTSARIFRLQIILTGVPSLLLIVLCQLLIPQGSLQSAAVVLLLAGSLSFLLKTVTIIQVLKKAPAASVARGIS
jgi:O-antigen/teichoic acid export membrane protein